MAKTLRIVTAVLTYAYKGKLFETYRRGTEERIDHGPLEDEFAQELLDTQGSPFREVDEDGNVIPNDSDIEVAEDAKIEAKGREFLTEAAKAKLAEGKGDLTVEEVRNPKPVTGKAAAKTKAKATEKPAAKKLEFGKKTTTPAPEASGADDKAEEKPANDPTTEGAVAG